VASVEPAGELESPEEGPAGLEIPGWPTLSADVTPHPEVDLHAPDPAVKDGKRFCVSTRRDGERCGAFASTGFLLCVAHRGLLDASRGGNALAAKRREARERAEREVAARALGTRALVAEVFEERALEVRRTVEHLLTAAATGDRAAAQALLPWIDQALGRPTERVETTSTRTVEDVRSLDPASLQALVAQGRAARLKLADG